MSGTKSWSDDAYSESDYDSQGYSVSVKNSSDNSSFNVNGSYHIAFEGPSSKSEAIIGYGEIRGAESFWDNWVAETTATHKHYGADKNSQISGVTVTAK